MIGALLLVACSPDCSGLLRLFEDAADVLADGHSLPLGGLFKLAVGADGHSDCEHSRCVAELEGCGDVSG